MAHCIMMTHLLHQMLSPGERFLAVILCSGYVMVLITIDLEISDTLPQQCNIS